MTTSDAPDFLEVVAPDATADVPPQPANFVSVTGDGALLALDFFYVPPGKLTRIFAEGDTPSDTQRNGTTVMLRSEPVARLALPLTTAADLALALIERIDEALPEVRESLSQFVTKLHDLSHGEGHDHHHDETEVTVADEGARRRPRG